MLRLLNASVIGGVALAAFGAAYLWVGSRYSLGTARNMGPGYFPLLVGSLIVLIGGILTLRGLAEASDRPEFHLRPIAAITAAIGAFWGLIGTFGLAPAILATVALACLAEPGPRILRVVSLTLFLLALSWAVFILALGLPLRLVRWP